MKNIKKIILYITLSFLVYSQSFAENKIAYLDIDFILSNTNIGKSVFQKLKAIEKDKSKKFKSEELKLKEEENKILASKTIITEDQLKINISDFQKKLKNYQKTKVDDINKLKKKRNDEIINLINLINPIIEDYASENSISILIDKKNIYLADKNLDITNNLIELIDKKIK